MGELENVEYIADVTHKVPHITPSHRVTPSPFMALSHTVANLRIDVDFLKKTSGTRRGDGQLNGCPNAAGRAVPDRTVSGH